jgi:four helix bundle protein
MPKKIVSHTELKVYRKAFDTAMRIFALSKSFPKEEAYSLTDQIHRSSLSVCANLGVAWRKRRYERAFVSKLSDAESEAAETRVWTEFAVKCEYVNRSEARVIYRTYDEVLRMLVAMINHPESGQMTPPLLVSRAFSIP